MSWRRQLELCNAGCPNQQAPRTSTSHIHAIWGISSFMLVCHRALQDRNRLMSRANCMMRYSDCLRVGRLASSMLLIGWLLVFGCPVRAGTVTVTDTGVSSNNTCTLAQAINAANNINLGGSADQGNCSGASGGANAVDLASAATYTFTAVDNYWYGPNALPPIQSNITVEGNGAVLVASHTGDPTPSAANAFRFFYVSGGLNGELPFGLLTLHNLT